MGNKKKTKCAICGTEDNSSTHVVENLVSNEISSVDVFSARRRPDRQTFRWVRCQECSLLRSDPIEDLNMEKLYRESVFTYDSELSNLKKTYKSLLKRTRKFHKNYTSILEIGGGNGFFLETALELGFDKVLEVEPSVDAMHKASEKIKNNFVTSLYSADLIYPKKFDVVAFFHVLDHVPNPIDFISQCKDALQPEGCVLLAVHNERSLSAKFLKSKSPIFDVEHTYLYSKRTLKILFSQAGYSEIYVKSYWNWYSIQYLLRLAPLPNFLRKVADSPQLNTILGKVNLFVPLGNLALIARE